MCASSVHELANTENGPLNLTSCSPQVHFPSGVASRRRGSASVTDKAREPHISIKAPHVRVAPYLPRRTGRMLSPAALGPHLAAPFSRVPCTTEHPARTLSTRCSPSPRAACPAAPSQRSAIVGMEPSSLTGLSSPPAVSLSPSKMVPRVSREHSALTPLLPVLPLSLYRRRRLIPS